MLGIRQMNLLNFYSLALYMESKGNLKLKNFNRQQHCNLKIKVIVSLSLNDKNNILKI